MKTKGDEMQDLVIQSLWKEKEELRNECIMLQTGVQKSVLILLTVLGVFSGIFLANDSVINESSKTISYILLSQIQVYLGFFILVQYSNLNVHAKYIAAIEDRLNNLFGEKVHIWEQEICPNYLFSPASSCLWAMVAVTLLMFALFTGSLFAASTVINTFWFGALIILELIALVGSIIHISIEHNYHPKAFKKRLGKTISEQ
ncbi:MAG: hypothetical protein JXR23_11180 [Pontiellaceae bacterium]|nr:hypothetical protein [Pontiellaceae bacterium]